MKLFKNSTKEKFTNYFKLNLIKGKTFRELEKLFQPNQNKLKSHPKSLKMVQLIKDYFKLEGGKDSKVIVFTNGRRNALELKTLLN